MGLTNIHVQGYINFITRSEQGESAGSSKWELLSIVDNKQRGSHERMIENLREVVEHKQKFKTES